MMTAGNRQRTIKPRCYGCGSGEKTHPYPKENASELQLNGTVAGGYEWLCPDCAYFHEHPDAVAEVRERPQRVPSEPQKERLFAV